MGSKMKAGDLVQSNIFDPNGSGAYGLVIAQYKPIPGFWNVRWCSQEWELSHGIVGAYEIHEKDLVVVRQA